jgi:copper resistance protein B
MKRLLLALLLGSAPIPALAQHEGHSMPGEDAGKPRHDHADPAPPAAVPHAGHDQASEPEESRDVHAGHEPGQTGTPPTAPPPPEALSGPAHAADQVYGIRQMEEAREEQLRGEHGKIRAHQLLIDRLEASLGEGPDGYAWSGQAWFGGDIDKAWFKTDGGGRFDGDLETAEVQLLWAHAVDPWFDLQLGVRHDFNSGPDRSHLVAGVQGLAPYWFDLEAALFLSDKGDVTARFEGEYDLRITQQLILQPRIELDLAAQDVEEVGIGAGLSTAEGGLRLRYEIDPRFAPYVGVQYERAFGETKDFRRAADEGAGAWWFLLGVRTWY